MYNTINVERRQDLFQTTTHTGHHWRDPYHFPSSNFEVKTNKKKQNQNFQNFLFNFFNYSS